MRRLITGVVLVHIIKRNRKAKALLSLGAVMATSAGLVGLTAPLATATPVSGLTFTASVIGVGSGSFTVRRANQAVTVEVSPTTTYSEHGVTSASLSNVLIGDRVTVNGSITSNNDVVDASHVQVLQLLPNDFDGTISSIGTGTFIAMRGNSPVNVDVYNADDLQRRRRRGDLLEPGGGRPDHRSRHQQYRRRHRERSAR